MGDDMRERLLKELQELRTESRAEAQALRAQLQALSERCAQLEEDGAQQRRRATGVSVALEELMPRIETLVERMRRSSIKEGLPTTPSGHDPPTRSPTPLSSQAPLAEDQVTRSALQMESNDQYHQWEADGLEQDQENKGEVKNEDVVLLSSETTSRFPSPAIVTHSPSSSPGCSPLHSLLPTISPVHIPSPPTAGFSSQAPNQSQRSSHHQSS